MLTADGKTIYFNNGSVGNIAGTIDASLTAPDGCTPGVYVYGGANITAPEDTNSAAASTDANQPIASKVPVATQSALTYQFTFLAPGSYTVAYTCQAAADSPDQNDSLTFAKRLVTEAGLGLAPGVAFGAEAEGWLRWCFASKAPQRLTEGVERLRRHLGL